MTPTDIARLRALAAAATPGPWTAEYDNSDDSGGGWWFDVGPARVRQSYRCSEEERGRARADAAFIAAARDALPAALDEIERLRARALAAEAALGEIVRGATLPMSSGDECRHCGGESDYGSRIAHTDWCPAGIARRALEVSRG